MIIASLARPFHLFFAAITYGLGSAIARYLGFPFSPAAFLLGISWSFLVQLTFNFLAEVFRPVNEPIQPGLFGAERVYLRDRLLYISIGCLVLIAGSGYLIFLSGHSTPASMIFLGSSMVALFIYAVPPISLSRRGFGELILAVHLGYIVPSLSFVLQVGDFHRLVPIFTLPVIVLALAYFLILDFPSFADDIKYERSTLLTNLGWQRAIQMHHGLVSGGFFLLALTPLAGVSLSLIWRVALALPFAIIQMLLLRSVGLGMRPLWTLLTLAAGTTFALTGYLLSISFLLR